MFPRGRFPRPARFQGAPTGAIVFLPANAGPRPYGLPNMLQKIRDKSSGWIAFLVLGLVILTMAFFGVDSYFAPKIETYSAKIEGPANFLGFGAQVREISQDEFRRRFEQARQQARQQQGDAFDSAAFEDVDNKRRVLDTMVDEQLLDLLAEREQIRIGESAVAEELKKLPEFQADGAYSPDLYRLGLAARGMTHAQFMAIVRNDMARSVIPSQVVGSGLATADEVDAFLTLSQQTRDLALFELPTPAAPAEPDEAALKAWYEANGDRYRSEEKVAIEFVEIDASMLEVPASADEQTLRDRYEEQRSRFVTEPQREAAHILVAVPADADAEADAAARARIEALAAQVRAEGADFAAVARENSDDLGSKAEGGYLGPVEAGVFAPAFEEALNGLQAAGDIAGPVRTADGWHLIQLVSLVPGSERSFDEVRAELEAEFQATERDRLFSDLSNRLIEAVYKDPTALAPAAESVGLTVQRTGLFGRAGGDGIAAIPAVREAAFTDNQKLERQTSDAIEIGPEHIVVIHVIEHQPEATLPYEQVAVRVRADLVADGLAKASEAQAQALLARAQAGETLDALATEVGRTVATLPGVGRQAPLPPSIIEEAFRLPAPAEGKPSVGIARVAADRHALLAVTAVTPGDLSTLDEATRGLLRDQLAQARGAVELQEYLKSLRQYYTVTVAEDRL